MSGRSAVTLALLVGASLLLAGCVGDEAPPAATGKAAEPPAETPPVATPPSNLTKGQTQWHFHDKWGDTDVLELMNGPVVMALGADEVGPGNVRSGGVEFTFPHGNVVPPETGRLQVTVAFTPAQGVPFTGLNFSYRPANVENFTSLGPIATDAAFELPVDWLTTDVPHATATGWALRLTAAPDARGIAVANGTAHVTVTAHRAYSVYIDPPHGDPWRLTSLATLLPEVEANVSAVKLPDGRYLVQEGDVASIRPSLLTFAPANGSIVPERTQTVLVRVAWSGAAAPDLGVTYSEPNSPSGGPMQRVAEGAGFRVFAVDVAPEMTDSPYAYRSLWAFALQANDPAGIINLAPVQVSVWASNLPAEAALAILPDG